MDSVHHNFQSNPRKSSNYISNLLFVWTIPLFKQTYRKVLDANDVNEPLPGDRSKVLGDRLEKKWNEECTKNQSPSLVRAVIKTFKLDCFVVGCLGFMIDIVLRLILPFYLEHLLLYFRKNSNVYRDKAFKSGVAMIVITVLSGVLYIHYSYIGYRWGMKVRVALSSLIYRKSLRLSQKALSDTTPGKLTNLLSNDVGRFEVTAVLMHYMWISPIMTTIATYMLWQEARWAGIIGLIPILLVVPFQSYTAKLNAMIRFKTALRIDERLRYMDEIISGVQVIKMYVWEKPFARLIAEVRRLETKQILKNAYIRALFMTCTLVINRVALFCSISSGMLLYGREYMSVSKMFIISYILIAISFTMYQRFIRGVAEIGEALVSLNRLQMFLEYSEKDQGEYIQSKKEDGVKSTSNAILLKNASAGWVDTTNQNHKKRSKKVGSYKSAQNSNGDAPRSFTLQEIDLEIPKGKLVFVIGSVGAGKSTLLQVLLRELPLICGSMIINGTFSYASQESWIFTSTVRQNITFGQPMDRARYDEVVQCTALKKDFAQPGAGDMTVVGENGTGLSGGQKARINLARAMYRKADIYLIDDPLGAVDTHVQSHLFNNCLGPKGYLARQNATRILITHQVHFLKEADWVIVLKNGKIETQGDYNDILKSGIDVSSILKTIDEGTQEEKIIAGNGATEITRKDSQLAMKKMVNSTSSLNSEKSLSKDNQKDKPEEENRLLKALEASSKGKVKGSLIVNYFKSAGRPITLVFLLVAFLIVQILANIADIWVAYWIRQEELRLSEIVPANPMNDTNNVQIVFGSSTRSTETYMHIYRAIIVLLFILTLLRSMTIYKFCANASKNLHDAMFNGLISTTLRFFDVNHSGRIMNRFSKDMGSTDEILPKVLLDAMQYCLINIGAMIVVIFTNTKFSVIILVLCISFWLVLRIYSKCLKNIKRLDGMTKSPIFSHINATLSGLTTVRAFRAQEILQKEFESHQDLNSGTFSMYIGTFCGFGMSLDIMSYVFVSCIICTFIFMSEGVTGDLVGLALTQTLRITAQLQWSAKQSQYHSIVLRLSSLISSLFRLAIIDGDILIDDVNTSSIELDVLRSRISIIPQEPTLFSGTLRRNLDPLEEYSDDRIWTALDNVGMKELVSGGGGLQMPVSARGQNFNTGQKQILCLARAILRRNRIILLDEATANVDLKTDEMIQRTIKQNFADSTVITIAHRLYTVIDSDRVLVMDAGVAVEYEEPYLLLQNKESTFRKMVEALGTQEYDRLYAIANEKYIRRNTSKVQ